VSNIARQTLQAFASYRLLNVGCAGMKSIEAPTAAVCCIERRRRSPRHRHRLG
jgi:hypothetical protein